MDDNRYLCIHCHFYQPPRENPWIEAVELQESAFPFHDWNERISAECYYPNGQARILDGEGRVVRLANNYSRISFNFGPTLLSWMEDHDPEAYQSILDGDRLARERFGGHGSAIAQVYNHMIMPLANRRDKETQIIWGLRDFEKRFERAAEAMWLPETAVDTETLEMLAAHDMKYVILAPRQAKAIRSLAQDQPWEDIIDENINPRAPYLINLPGGKQIAAFFYDGGLSQAIAFEGLLHNGEHFAARLIEGFVDDDAAEEPQLLHIATDGESYGHHHNHGEMALAYALDHIEENELARISNYAEFLAQHPPEYEVQIHDNSSWSCVHGVERWRSDCGCNTGGSKGWNQQWRGPLREAFDLLRDKVAQPWEDFMTELDGEPWARRDDYIDMILDRSDTQRAQFLARFSSPGKKSEEQIFKAMEIQRNLMLAYTSCGWFFDEISGIEGVQNLQYAARAIELTREVLGLDLSAEFKKILARAPSNIGKLENGANIYDKYVLPACVDMLKVTAHIAANAMFDEPEEAGQFYAFDYTVHERDEKFSGKAMAAAARLKLTAHITREVQEVEYCAIHMGDHNINLVVRPYTGDEAFYRMRDEVLGAFARGDLAKALRMLERHSAERIYALSDLFRDQQKRIIGTVLSQTLESLEEQFGSIYREHYAVMCFVTDSGLSLPPPFSAIAGYVQNSRIWHALEKQDEDVDMEEIKHYAAEARDWHLPLEQEKIRKVYSEALQRYFDQCTPAPGASEPLARFSALLEFKDSLAFDVDLGKLQNRYLTWVQKLEPAAESGDPGWHNLITKIGDQLRVRVTL